MTRVYFFLLLAAVGALAIPRPAGAQTPRHWSEPVQIGTELPSSWFPDLNADPAGAVRVVWSANLDEGNGNVTQSLSGAVMIAELRDGAWTRPADLTVMNAGTASRPFIVSDGAWAYMIYRTERGYAQVRLAFQRAPLSADLANARNWSEPYPLTSDETYWASLLALPDGTLLVAFNQMTPTIVNGVEERRPALFMRRSTDQGVTWSVAERVSDGVGRVGRVSVASSPSGALVAAWDEGYNNLDGTGSPEGVATAVSSDGGATWSTPWRFAGQLEQSMVATNGATTVLVYRSTLASQILFRTSNDGGQTWSAQGVVPGATARPYTNPHNFDKLSTAFDGDGRLLLAYVGEDGAAPQKLSVMVTSYENGAWNQPEVIASPDGFPEYPRVVVSLGNQITVVYFVRDNQFDVGRYTLWSSSVTTSARAVAPAMVTPAAALVRPSAVPIAPIRLVPNPIRPGSPGPLSNASGQRARPQSAGAEPVQRAAIATLVTLLVLVAVMKVGRSIWNARV